MSIVTGVSARACPSRSGVRGGDSRGRAEQFYRREGGVNRRVTTRKSLVHGVVWIDSTDTNEIRVTIGERVGVFFTTSTYYVWANSAVFTTESNLAPVLAM